MTNIKKPAVKPSDGRFSPGPSRKRPGWTPDFLKNAALGRSHRSPLGKQVLKRVIDLTREVLEVPDTHKIAIVPASDTGAVEMAMWSMLGPRGIDVMAWENFGYAWITDAQSQLPLEDIRIFKADYGKLPDINAYDGSRDLVFTWNGTTGGARVPNADFIPADREGITICDATSAAFAQELEWDKLDVTTYSWQKNMGGEAGHGMLVLSPRAVERLETYTPPWPLPKIFRMTKNGKLNQALFQGSTLNTPSLMCAEDHIETLEWVKKQGGLGWMYKRADNNFKILQDWLDQTDWVENLCKVPDHRSNTGVCMEIIDPRFKSLSAAEQSDFASNIVKMIAEEGVAYDFGSYRTAPPGFRVWASGLIEPDDIKNLLPWLEWGFAVQSQKQWGNKGG